MNTQTLALFFFVAIAIGGVLWVFVYPLLSGERQVEKRRESVARSTPVARAVSGRGVQKSRREQVEETLKDLEAKNQKNKRPPLQIRITQAGLDWTKQRFMITAAGMGLVGFLLGLVSGAGLLVALALGFAGGAGLPLLDSLKAIAVDAPEPTKSEFRAIVETQTIGMPLGEACAKLYERMPLAEANFFGIVISIQQKAGGNLSEALGNLSRVLRDRKKMKAKIKAMSMEAKASAYIIGSLPIAVGALVYLTSPDYIELLWTHDLGRMMIAGCAMWMFIGVMVMKKMINFDF
jgi:tight adherence protein B